VLLEAEAEERALLGVMPVVNWEEMVVMVFSILYLELLPIMPAVAVEEKLLMVVLVQVDWVAVVTVM
jgi:hypothetical protein